MTTNDPPGLQGLSSHVNHSVSFNECLKSQGLIAELVLDLNNFHFAFKFFDLLFYDSVHADI